jgi:hypothetical protein
LISGLLFLKIFQPKRLESFETVGQQWRIQISGPDQEEEPQKSYVVTELSTSILL